MEEVKFYGLSEDSRGREGMEGIGGRDKPFQSSSSSKASIIFKANLSGLFVYYTARQQTRDQTKSVVRTQVPIAKKTDILCPDKKALLPSLFPTMSLAVMVRVNVRVRARVRVRVRIRVKVRVGVRVRVRLRVRVRVRIR